MATESESESEFTQLTVYVLLNEIGEYVASDDEDAAQETFDSNGYNVGAVRKIVLNLKASTPKALELTATLPPEEGATGSPITLTIG